MTKKQFAIMDMNWHANVRLYQGDFQTNFDQAGKELV